ncbi:Uncharacterised protein [Vibrio cholerae]|uniref:Uncharacterized protein n=1 Tax=Vibrio cholerae TaxID=666 RepID=A0A655UJQ0_VIBCL|nr:Uncharacterised protein [Vibrio cholerae]CSB09241.1 Uncharacterised protein [Vibrio cholerae]CSB50879.1 Uncharacterised protein [Vibrio cholerae]
MLNTRVNRILIGSVIFKNRNTINGKAAAIRFWRNINHNLFGF